MADTQSEYADYEGKQVRIVYVDPDDSTKQVEAEGKIEVVNDEAVMFKPKGKTLPLIIDNEDIEELALSEKVSKITQSSIQAVELGRARKHLADRHGYELSSVNDMTEEAAAAFHDELHADETAAKEISHKHKGVESDDDDDEAGSESDDS